MFSCYYLYDLSLSEISEPEGKTRQNVYESIKKVKAKLLFYENTLKLAQKNRELNAVAQDLLKKDVDAANKIIDIIGK